MRRGFKNLGIVTKLIIGFSLIFFMILGIITVSHKNSDRIIDSTHMIIHTQEVLTDLAEIEAKLIDLETGQRGFIITGKPQYLEPYNTSMNIIDSKLNDLRNLTSDNKSQTIRIDQLKELVKNKIHELNSTIELRLLDDGFERARKIVMTDLGKEIMDKIRVLISEIKEEELRLLAIRSKAPNESKEITDKTLLILLFFSLLISTGIAIIVSRSITKPLKKLQKGTQEIGDGNLDYSIALNRKDEIGQLARSFQQMLDKLKVTMASRDILEKEIENRKQTEIKLIKVNESLEKSEAQLIESNKTKDKFFSIIAHDLRSPFNSMLGLSEILNTSYEDFTEEEQKQQLKVIHTGIKNSLKLLNNLLIWSRSQTGTIEFKPENVNLSEAVDGVINLLKLPTEEKSIDIKNQVSLELIIHADKNMLSTILRNLLSNAIKFSHAKGNVIVTAILPQDVNNGFVEVAVKDHGIGIPEHIQSKLFKAGEKVSTKGTANEKGTGLGLNICKEFVEKHQGKIWVKTEEGKGSIFHFTLPLSHY
ncbi:HAMP domain-containing protein [Prolixibacteraceae bacterium JC049]|nr:HAMP domain-containing protein [Prolixibacteraceae bacterium JC049]